MFRFRVIHKYNKVYTCIIIVSFNYSASRRTHGVMTTYTRLAVCASMARPTIITVQGDRVRSLSAVVAEALPTFAKDAPTAKNIPRRFSRRSTD